MADNQLKTAAETLRRRLQLRLCALREAQAWADDHILAMATPHEWLIDLSVAKTTAEARDALLLADGVPDATQVWAALMREWLVILERDPERDSEIAKVLYDLAMNDEAPAREAFGPMYSFWDAIDLAKEGSHGVLEEEREQLLQFLRRWST